MKIVTLLAAAIALSSCTKNNPAPDQTFTDWNGTYKGTMHAWGSFARTSPGGIVSGKTDTVYNYEVTVSALDDSVTFSYPSGLEYRFLKDSSNIYCTACDPTRNLHRFTWRPFSDSLIVDFHFYGGSGGSYNSHSSAFRGKYE